MHSPGVRPSLREGLPAGLQLDRRRLDPRDLNVSLPGPESWLHTGASSESLTVLCFYLLLLLLCPISREKSLLLHKT